HKPPGPNGGYQNTCKHWGGGGRQEQNPKTTFLPHTHTHARTASSVQILAAEWPMRAQRERLLQLQPPAHGRRQSRPKREQQKPRKRTERASAAQEREQSQHDAD